VCRRSQPLRWTQMVIFTPLARMVKPGAQTAAHKGPLASHFPRRCSRQWNTYTAEVVQEYRHVDDVEVQHAARSHTRHGCRIKRIHGSLCPGCESTPDVRRLPPDL